MSNVVFHAGEGIQTIGKSVDIVQQNIPDGLCCVSCGFPLSVQPDVFQPVEPLWFEHDQMTVAEKIRAKCMRLDPAEKEARRLHLQGMTASHRPGRMKL
ncbi:putative zinc ribbon protein [Escherichia coli]